MDELLELIIRGLAALFSGEKQAPPPPRLVPPRAPPPPLPPGARPDAARNPNFRQPSQRPTPAPKPKPSPVAAAPAAPVAPPPAVVKAVPKQLINASDVRQLLSKRQTLARVFVLCEVIEPPLAMRPTKY